MTRRVEIYGSGGPSAPTGSRASCFEIHVQDFSLPRAVFISFHQKNQRIP